MRKEGSLSRTLEFDCGHGYIRSRRVCREKRERRERERDRVDFFTDFIEFHRINENAHEYETTTPLRTPTKRRNQPTGVEANAPRKHVDRRSAAGRHGTARLGGGNCKQMCGPRSIHQRACQAGR